jgi:hypothetical protein
MVGFVGYFSAGQPINGIGLIKEDVDCTPGPAGSISLA